MRLFALVAALAGIISVSPASAQGVPSGYSVSSGHSVQPGYSYNPAGESDGEPFESMVGALPPPHLGGQRLDFNRSLPHFNGPRPDFNRSLPRFGRVHMRFDQTLPWFGRICP